MAWGYIEKYTAAAEVESLLNSVNATTIVANDFAFAIIDGNGTVSAFGDPLCGGVIATESTLVQNFLRNNITKQVFASSRYARSHLTACHILLFGSQLIFQSFNKGLLLHWATMASG